MFPSHEIVLDAEVNETHEHTGDLKNPSPPKTTMVSAVESGAASV